MKLVILCSALLCLAAAYEENKAKVVDDKTVSGTGFKGDTFNSKITGDGSVKTDYEGKDGKVGKGTGNAETKGKGDSFVALGPKGEKVDGTVDKSKKILDAKTDKGGTIKADVSSNTNGKAVVNGKDEYNVVQDGKGNAQVFPKNSKTAAHSVSNLRENTDKVDIRTPNKPQQVAYLNTKKSGSKLDNVNAAQAENQLPGVNVGQLNSVDLTHESSSKSDIKIGQAFGATDPKLRGLSVGAAGEVSSDAVDTKPCYGGKDADALGNSGIKIEDKSIKFELIKNAAGEYEFPSCFNAFANVFVPAGVDVKDLAAHASVRVAAAGGEMQCDAKVACLDKATRNRPPGSCFFCDFCKKDQPQGAFGLGSEANICDAKAAQTLPLKWKICPPEKDYGKFAPFLPAGQASSDIVSTLRLFLRKSGAWTEVSCRQSTYSFKVGFAGRNAIGAKKTDTKLEQPKAAAAGSNPLGNLFGKRK